MSLEERGSYVERSQFRIPHLENGVRGLGDLYNCRNSQSLGHNLFRTANFSAESLQARPIKSIDHKFTHVKNELDTTKSLKVEGHLSLDLLLKTITLEGNFLYRNNETQRENVETINCTYVNECYQIDLMPPVDAIVNSHVLQKICDKEIEATHVVGGVIVGAMVSAVIEIKEKDSNSKGEASGKGGFTRGASNSENKAGSWLNNIIGGLSGNLNVNWESDEANAHLDISVTCKAQPMPENLPAPSSVKALLDLIEKIPSAMSNEKHFPMFGNEDIAGVPVQFILYPLSHFVKLEIALLYKQLEDDLLGEFQKTISKASDIQQRGYIKKLILEQDSRLKWLLDQKSCLSEKVKASENQLRQVGQSFIKLCRETLKEYKYGRCNTEELGRIVTDFNTSEAGSINMIVEKFVDEGNVEILESKAADDLSKIRYLTDKFELKRWLESGSKPKALLEVKSPCPSAVVRTFLELENALSALEIEMGMVMPSISEEAKLHLVFRQRKLDLKDTKMRVALEILHASLCDGNKTQAIFYRIVAELNGIKFPMQKSVLQDWDQIIETFIQVLGDFSNFYIAESSNDLQRFIRTLSNDTMAFCVPVDAPETAIDFFINWKDNKLRSLQGVKWVVCSSDCVKTTEAPLLMVFARGEIHAVLLDQLDLHILKHQIKSEQNYHVTDMDMSMLSVNQLQNSLYAERALYTYRVLSYLAPTTFMDACQQPEKASVNLEVEELITIITSCLSSNIPFITSTVAEMAAETFPRLNETFKTCGWNDACKKFDPSMLFGNQRLQLIHELEEWLASKSLVNEIDNAEKLLTDQQNMPLPNKLRLIALQISDHSHCPVTYKRRLKEKRTADLHMHILQALRELRSEIESTKSNSMYFHVAALKSCLNRCDSCEQETTNSLTNFVVKKYFEKMKCAFPECTVANYLHNNQLYMLLSHVSIYKYNKWQFILYDSLRRLSSLKDFTTLSTSIEQLTETNVDEHTEILWKNDKWLFLVRNCLDAENGTVVLQSIQQWLQKAANKNVFPEDIRRKLIGTFHINREKATLSTMSDFKRFLESIVRFHDDTPWYFRDVLTEALKQNPNLELELLQADVLAKWNGELKILQQEWSLDEIRVAITRTNDAIRSYKVQDGNSANTAVNFHLELKDPIMKSDQLKIHSMEPIIASFQHVMGQNLIRISDTDYLAVRRISDHPQMQQFGTSALLSVMPYIIQQVKLWDGNILRFSRISEILTMDEDEETMICEDPFISESSSSTENQRHNTELKQPINRLDCFAFIINAASCLVGEEILRVLSKFPLSLPLVVPDFTKNNKYIITVPLLKNLVIRWETISQEKTKLATQNFTEQGQIIENHLFSSSYRMVVAVRLGTNKTGKSQILNQMMAYPYFFSSRAETSGELCPPCTLHGTVEFTWLTEETCSDWLWTRLLKSHYADGKDEIVLLANLHGNATQFPDTLSYLKSLACCFIVFIMPDCDQQQWIKFKSEATYNPINCVKVDCGGSKMISTSRLTHTDTQDKLRGLMKWALKMKLNQRNAMEVQQTECWSSLQYAEVLKTDESEEAIQLLKSHGCCEIRKFMKDLAKNGYEGWKRNPRLQELVSSISNIFNYCVGPDLKKAMIHLETELAKKSATESIKPRRNVAEAQRKLQLVKFDIKQNSRNDASEMLSSDKINERMITEIELVNDTNLGPEHFFRTFGVIYHTALGHHNSDKCDVLHLPKYYADLVLKGHAIEILNGDTGEIPLDWFRAICNNICEMQPNLRVFVISIIGLQSSGKSTLLNALFACRFAVSVGRCSRGLYMRMIFLEEDLRKDHGFDAIIIIDTEGLASPEKMNDPEASRKDRLLATFAMGLSNLTIVNVLGEELTKMTEILQIVIVTMARLREADVKPDMLVVQHLQERNPSKLDEAKRQFIDAIKRAFELVHKSDIELGATQNACLTELMHGIQCNDMFLQFSSFKNGSSVHAPPSESYHADVAKLYKILLDRARYSTSVLPFQRWFQLAENYWHSVTNEKFALNFKSAQHITEFLYFGHKVAKIKEAVGYAFRSHRDIFSEKISEQGKKLEHLREKMTSEMTSELEDIPYCCPQKCDSCKSFRQMQQELSSETKDPEWECDLKETIDRCIRNKQNSELKILKQIFDVSILRHGCFSDFSHLITKELKDELAKKPDGKFSDKQKTKISARIWNRVKKIASSKETGAPLMEEIEKAIQGEYGEIHPDIYHDVEKEWLNDDNLQNQPATGPGLISLRGQNQPLSKNKCQNLVYKVQSFVNALLTSFNPQCFEVGMKFEAGMIMSIRHNIPEMLNSYERENKLKLLQEFKYTVILHVLGVFIKKMKAIQEIWDRQNKPSIILHGKENLYKDEIKTRLEHGFSSASDGYVKAGYIIEEIKERAKKAAYRGKLQSILDHVWTTNSEKVRLQYFEELALKVRDGEKQQAIAHFNNPQESIENWFKQKIESIYSKKKVQDIHEQTLTTEIERILSKLNSAETSDELDSFLQEYQGSANDDSSGNEVKIQENFISYRDSITCKIKRFFMTYKNDLISCPSASEDIEVMNRLGCTESCPWCGALCWGSRGHHEDEGEIRKHHSCHQPNGLIGTEINENLTRYLDPRVCQDIPDKDLVFLDGYRNSGLRWGLVKTQYFATWKFDSHVIKKFDEMMHWFFQELHNDMSAVPGRSPVPPQLLEKFKCTDLKLEDILAAVSSIKD